MDASVCIEQKGVVEEIINRTAMVRIHRESMCGECNVKGICNLSDEAERIVEIHQVSDNIHKGDHVLVSVTRSMGNKALMLGYLFPFLILITTLALFNSVKLKDWLTGTLSILIVIIYYFALWLFRNLLRRTFSFKISKPD